MAETGPLAEAEIVDLSALLREGERWDALAADALRPTPFYTRQVMSAHAAHGFAPGVRAVAVRRGSALAAVLPFRSVGRIGWGVRPHRAWTSFITPSSLPLVSARDPADAVRALLDGIAALPWRPFVFPFLPVEEPAGRLLRHEAARRGWATEAVSAFDRPVLDLPADGAAYEAALKGGRGRDLARRRRRLAEGGALVLRSAASGPELQDAIEVFLRLELGGWKGRRGSALASRPELAAFARELFRPGDGPVAARADVLAVGGEPIAASLALSCGGTTFLLKSAYDERFARCAPGILMEDAIVRASTGRGETVRLNSAATDPTPLDALYPGRERLVDLLLYPAPGGEGYLRRLATAERNRRRWSGRAKTLGRTVLDRLRR